MNESNVKLLKYPEKIVRKIFGKKNEDAKIPTNGYFQKSRSLQFCGISDDQLRNIIADYADFSAKNYKPVSDPTRIISLVEAIRYANQLDGDIVECGVFQGSTAKILHFFSNVNKSIFLLDTFTGFTADDRAAEKSIGLKRDPGQGHINTSLEFAQARVFSKIEGLESPEHNENVIFLPGPIQETLEPLVDRRFCFVHLDMDLYAPTKYALEFFIPKLVTHGVLVLHDYAVNDLGYKGVYEAVKSVETGALLGPFPFGDASTALFIKN
jgi:O-methyltransferase